VFQAIPNFYFTPEPLLGTGTVPNFRRFQEPTKSPFFVQMTDLIRKIAANIELSAAYAVLDSV